MKNGITWWGMGATALMLSACASLEPYEEDGAPAYTPPAQVETQPMDSTGMGAQAEGAQMGGMAEIHPLDDPDSPLSQRVFYFGYNSSELSDNDSQILSAHADFLNNNPDVSVVVEGHTDERGSREYNIALGERRAQRLEKILALHGVKREQLQVISFGEERPVALGHDESAWSLNRRVELLYSGY